MQLEMLRVEQGQLEMVISQQKERIQKLEDFDRSQSAAFKHLQQENEKLELQIV